MPWYIVIDCGTRFDKGGPYSTENDAVRMGLIATSSGGASNYYAMQLRARRLADAGPEIRQKMLELGLPLKDIHKRHFKQKES
jgi:hypothetical protein